MKNVAQMAKLFDDFDRTDPTPAPHQEDSFAFMNRIATPWWSRVRGKLEEWFADYCVNADADKAADLRARFRNRRPQQHLAAWWELYVYWLLRSLHPEKHLAVEPKRLTGETRPDFCVMADANAPPQLWVEAVTAFSGIVEEGRHAAREGVVLDAINELKSADFFLSIEFRSTGPEQPKKRDIVGPLEAWLADLDHDDVVAAIHRGESLPRKRIAVRDWDIILEARPKSTPGIRPDDRLISIGPVSAGYVNDVGAAKTAIVRKSSHYDDLEAPLVVAVMPTSPFFDDEDAVAALYGSEAVQFDPGDPESGRLVRLRDGAWSTGKTDAFAVLFGPRVLPWTVGKIWPQLWQNPYAMCPVPSAFLRLPRVEFAEDGSLQKHAVATAPASLLGLDPSWPGPEDPFAV